MESGSSSPFIEQPCVQCIEKEDQIDYKQKFLALKFHLEALTTEKRLIDNNRKRTEDCYIEKLEHKSNEIKTLEIKLKSTVLENKKTEEKLFTLEKQHAIETQKTWNEMKILKKEDEKKKNEITKLEQNYYNLTRSIEKQTKQIEIFKNQEQEYIKQIEVLKNDVLEITDKNENFIQQIQKYSETLNEKSEFYALNEDYRNRNSNLQRINNQLQIKIDELLQNMTSVELMRQQNDSLKNQIAHLQQFEEKYFKLEFEHSLLKEKFEDYFSTLIESLDQEKSQTDSDNSSNIDNKTKIHNFIKDYKHLQFKILLVEDKFKESNFKFQNSLVEVSDLKKMINDNLKVKIDSLENEIKNKDKKIFDFKKQKVLNQKEIDFFRNLVKNLKKFNNERSKTKTDDESTNQYLTSLEKLVDDYKNEVDFLQKQLQLFNSNSESSVGEKRLRLLDNLLDNNDFKTELNSLRTENTNLNSNVFHKSQLISELEKKVKSLEEIKEKKKNFQILQLKINPLSKDQIVKQKTLDLLRKENENLINTYIKKLDSDSQISKSVFEREEMDKIALQVKTEHLTKRIERLKQAYLEKSKEILLLISKYFGYSIEFISHPINSNDLSSRIKLTSRFLNPENKNAHLIIDINSKSLNAFGNCEFKNLCEDLKTKWNDKKGQIPCFLSELNLKLYETVVNE